MSNIWIQCAGASNAHDLRVDPWRVVESQHQVSTRKLVDSDAEQQVLEQLIESAKPPERTRGRMHYLLFTPFRYPPLRYGSRFGVRHEPGIWYGAETLRTAFAEVAYYRLLFLEGTSADLGLLQTELTSFRAAIRTRQGIDLTRPPFSAFRDSISNPVSYSDSQPLGSAMREANVEAFRFHSARDVDGGTNVGVFSPAAFGRRIPRNLETWHCSATRDLVDIVKRDYFTRESFNFNRTEFLVDEVLPSPSV